MGELDGKVAVITGGGSGIGRATCLTFGRAGARVVVAGRTHEKVLAVARELEAEQIEALPVAVDVSDEARVEDMVDRVLRRWGEVHILINNAGISRPRLIEEIPVEEWRRTLDVNLTGQFLCAKALIPSMKKNRHGKMVNVSSTAGRRISANSGADYATSKAGVITLTRHLAYELAPYGINVNAICPGPTRTPMLPGGSAEAQRVNLRRIPLGRMASPEELAKVMLFLVSETASFLTGAIVDVDGGASLGWTDVESYYRARGVALE